LVDAISALDGKLGRGRVDVTNVRYNGTVHDVALPNSSLDVPAPAPPYGRPPPTPATNSAEVIPPVDPWARHSIDR
jgi:hypothetical protein